jgi:hypothetical protein
MSTARRFEIRDRREIATLGLGLWLSGVVASPLMHAVLVHGSEGVHREYLEAWVYHGRREAPVDHHDAPHSHPMPGAPHQGAGHTHPEGSLEHLGACCLPPVPNPVVVPAHGFFEECSALVRSLRPSRRVWKPEMPQAP